MSARLEDSIERARAKLRGPEFRRFFRYSMVSVVSSATSLVGLYFFYRVVKVGSAAWANVIATAIATVPSYYLNRTWAWKRSGKSHLMREVVPFWVISFVSLLLSTGVVSLASHEAASFKLSHTETTGLVEFANFFTYGMLWIGKFFFFNKVLFASREEPDDEGEPGEPVAQQIDDLHIKIAPGGALAP